MKISEIIAELQRIQEREGDLVVVHYSFEKHWEAVGRISVLGAGRPHDRGGKKVHSERVVEIGERW